MHVAAPPPLQFGFFPSGDGYSLRSQHLSASKCVDADHGDGSNGVRLLQWDCHGGANQRVQVRTSAATAPTPTPDPTPVPAPVSGTCGEGQRGNGICPDPTHCCSSWGWCNPDSAWCNLRHRRLRGAGSLSAGNGTATTA